jgi:hypothetical protein
VSHSGRGSLNRGSVVIFRGERAQAHRQRYAQSPPCGQQADSFAHSMRNHPEASFLISLEVCQRAKKLMSTRPTSRGRSNYIALSHSLKKAFVVWIGFRRLILLIHGATPTPSESSPPARQYAGRGRRCAAAVNETAEDGMSGRGGMKPTTSRLRFPVSVEG